MLFSLRVSLPDEPGMLGLLATALGQSGANILTLDVIDRGDGIAVDDLCVEAPDGLTEALRRAAEEVPGGVVEAVRPMEAFRDVLSPMELAASLAEVPANLAIESLVDGVPGAMWASWCVALRAGVVHPEVTAASACVPSFTNVETPWLPLDRPRRFNPAPWMPPAWRMGRMSYELAAVPLTDSDHALLVAHKHGPRFRSSELKQLSLLAQIAIDAHGRLESPAPV